MKEYEVVSCSSELSSRKMARTATQEINDHVAEGWEVHTVTSSVNAINIVFIREKQNRKV
ncbi:MAG TPA: DUF4177 domain-containing protein [bacterium]|nr:DUF4177 domain-containing protein [bacterium]